MPIFSLELLNESINFSIILHPKEAIKKGIPVQLFIVIFLCLLGIVLTIISQFTNLFYYFDEKNIYHRSALYPLSVVLGLLPGLSVSLGGIIAVLVIVSITGISLPEKTLIIDEPYIANDSSKAVCVTFARNAEKHWVDEAYPDRTGAQYDGMFFNNMRS